MISKRWMILSSCLTVICLLLGFMMESGFPGFPMRNPSGLMTGRTLNKSNASATVATAFSPFLINTSYTKLQELVSMWEDEQQDLELKLERATQLLVEIISDSDYINHKPNAGMVFIKTFKTGSSTITSVLHSLATSHQLIAPVVQKIVWTPTKREGILHQPTTQRSVDHAPYDIWCNHVRNYDNILLNRVVPSAQGRFFSILRDPATRVKSANFYYTNKCQFTKEQLKANAWEDLVLMSNQTLTKKMKTACALDSYTPQIVGHGVNPKAKFNDNLQAMYEKVDNGDLFLMVTERMVESLLVLWGLYDLHPLDVTFMAMKVQESTTSEDVSEKRLQADQLIRELAPLDTALHKRADEVLTQHLEDIFAADESAQQEQAVSELSTLNDIVYHVCNSILGKKPKNNAAKYTKNTGNGLGYWCLEKSLDNVPWNKFHRQRLAKNKIDDMSSYYDSEAAADEEILS